MCKDELILNIIFVLNYFLNTCFNTFFDLIPSIKREDFFPYFYNYYFMKFERTSLCSIGVIYNNIALNVCQELRAIKLTWVRLTAERFLRVIY